MPDTHDESDFGPPAHEEGHASPDLLSVAWRRKWLVLLGAVTGLVVGSLYYTQCTPAYRSFAQVLVIKKRPDALPITGSEARASAFEDYLATHQVLIRSPLIVGRAAKKRELQTLKMFENGADPASTIMESLAVARDSKEAGAPSSVLNLTFKGRVQDECGVVLGAVIDSYREFLDETYKNVSEDTLELIRKARDYLQKELSQKEAEYREFRQKAPAYWIGKEGINIHRERLHNIESRRAALALRQSEIQASLAAIEEAKKSGRRGAELIAFLPQPGGRGPVGESRRGPSASLEEQLLPLLLQ
jgi:uncharacterized protein involved in exopolysaccharide biosynthesis